MLQLFRKKVLWYSPFPPLSFSTSAAAKKAKPLTRSPRATTEKAAKDSRKQREEDQTLLPSVVLIGRPNVGKSALFNRLVRRKEALIYDTPGGHVTRDYREGIAQLSDLRFKLFDTAGMEADVDNQSLLGRAMGLTAKLLSRCHLALFMLDARAGVQPMDLELARWLHRTNRLPVVLAANKCEGGHRQADYVLAALGEAYQVGYGEAVAISAESGEGLADLYEKLQPHIDCATAEISAEHIRRKEDLAAAARPPLLAPASSTPLKSGQSANDASRLAAGSSDALSEARGDVRGDPRGNAHGNASGNESALPLIDPVSAEEGSLGGEKWVSDERGLDVRIGQSESGGARSKEEGTFGEMKDGLIGDDGRTRGIAGVSERETESGAEMERLGDSRAETTAKIEPTGFVGDAAAAVEHSVEADEEFARLERIASDFFSNEAVRQRIFVSFSEMGSHPPDSSTRGETLEALEGVSQIKQVREGLDESAHEDAAEQKASETRHTKKDSEQDSGNETILDEYGAFSGPAGEKASETRDTEREPEKDSGEGGIRGMYGAFSEGQLAEAQQRKQQLEDAQAVPLQFAIAGRPNVGKSTLVNYLLGQDRVLTGPEPGLTRDSVRIPFEHNGRPIWLVDTAGWMHRSKLEAGGPQLSAADARKSIMRAHVVALVLDAEEITSSGVLMKMNEITLASWVLEEGRALIVLVNKIDCLFVPDQRKLTKKLEAELNELLPQARGAPIMTLSALNGQGARQLMPKVVSLYDSWKTRLSTARLNRWLQKVDMQLPNKPGYGVRVRYITQVKARPPTFVVFVSGAGDFPASRLRFLANGIRKEFGMEGVPIRMQEKRVERKGSRGASRRRKR